MQAHVDKENYRATAVYRFTEMVQVVSICDDYQDQFIYGKADKDKSCVYI